MSWYIIACPKFVIEFCIKALMVGYSNKHCAIFVKKVRQFGNKLVEIWNMFKNVPECYEIEGPLYIRDTFSNFFFCEVGSLGSSDVRWFNASNGVAVLFGFI